MFALSKEVCKISHFKKLWRTVVTELTKTLKFVDKLNNVFVKITIYSPIENLDVSPEHCNRVYL
jgi:hypothetical protein